MSLRHCHIETLSNKHFIRQINLQPVSALNARLSAGVHALLLQLQRQSSDLMESDLPLPALMQSLLPATFCHNVLSGLLRLADVIHNTHSLGVRCSRARFLPS